MKKILSIIGVIILSFAVIPDRVQAADKSSILGADKDDKNSLFNRLGGQGAIEAVVDQFVANNDADEVISHRWKATDVAGLKEHLVELICEATGGPCIYYGSSMEVAHNDLKITENEFNRVAANLISALDKFKVPEKEKGELLNIVGSLKGKIVGQ